MAAGGYGDLERDLWEAADQLRANSKLTATEYCMPVLGIITGFAVITPTTVPTAFLVQATTSREFVGDLENLARGAAYPAVVAGDFERAEIVVPKAHLIRAFNELVEPMLAQSKTLRQENLKLRAARDLLLPKLMSGEMAV